MYELKTPEENNLPFYRLDGEAAERYGAVGYLRCDFGKDGREFRATWFDSQPRLKTPAFKTEFDAVINSLRDDGPKPPFASRSNLERFCAENAGHHLPGGAKGFKVQTLNYTYAFHCAPGRGDYDVRVYAYDNRWLLPELAGSHDMPQGCYSILPSTGEIILIRHGEIGYSPIAYQTGSRESNRLFVNEKNSEIGIGREQEEAMLAGSLFGWDTPAAKPWKYDKDGNPRPAPPRKDAPER
jgi:hypothetical protein